MAFRLSYPYAMPLIVLASMGFVMTNPKSRMTPFNPMPRSVQKAAVFAQTARNARLIHILVHTPAQTSFLRLISLDFCAKYDIIMMK